MVARAMEVLAHCVPARSSLKCAALTFVLVLIVESV